MPDSTFANLAGGALAGASVDVDNDKLPISDASVPRTKYITPKELIANSTSFLQSGTGAVARTMQARLRDWVSVKDFGAVGDGTTDDTAAIQAAIDSITASTGGAVFFPAGVYKTTATINATRENLTLFGVGENGPSGSNKGSQILAAHAGDIISAGDGPGVQTIADTLFSVRDMMLRGGGVARDGINLDAFRGARLYRVSVTSVLRDGFRFGTATGSYTAELEDCYVASPTVSAFHISAPHVKLTRCVSDGGQYSVLIDGDGDYSFHSQCHYEGATTAAIRIDGTNRGGNKILGNFIFSSGKNAYGIFISSTATHKKNQIVGNVLLGTGADGTGGGVGILVQSTNGDHDVIVGNDITDYEYGISLTGDNNSIGANTIDVQRDGILVAGDNNTFTGVQITAAGTNAINVTSGTGNVAVACKSSQTFNGITTIDDKVGTWTPSVGGTATYTARNGTYVKVGREVTIRGSITINAIGTGSTTTISGIPYATSGSESYAGAVLYFASLPSNVTMLVAEVFSSSITFTSLGAAAATATSTTAVFQNGTRIDFSCTYITTAQ